MHYGVDYSSHDWMGIEMGRVEWPDGIYHARRHATDNPGCEIAPRRLVIGTITAIA
jgi:hypothetical protein